MSIFLAIGEVMIELADAGNGLMKKGVAGDTFNTAYYARAFLGAGWEVDYFTALGDDQPSRAMLDFMENQGIGTHHIALIAGRSPGLHMIHVTNGERSFSYWRDQSAARRLAEDGSRLRSAILGSDVIYFSGITLAILPAGDRIRLFEALGDAKAAGKTVAFDPNIRPRLWQNSQEMGEAITRGASVATIVLPGFDDERVHFGDADPAATIARYQGVGARDVIVKDGAKGVTMPLSGRLAHIEAVPVSAVIDTTGAGDSFNGAYLARIISGDDPEHAARFAARIASIVISHAGALIGKDRLAL